MLNGVILTPLKQIEHPKGDILHGMKCSDQGFDGFGEAYFSTVIQGVIKGWKRHTKMQMNLIVLQGEIKFVLYDDRNSGNQDKRFYQVCLSKKNYCRLTVPPGLWMAFQGVGPSTNMLLNVSSIEHDPEEANAQALDQILYDWNKQ